MRTTFEFELYEVIIISIFMNSILLHTILQMCEQ